MAEGDDGINQTGSLAGANGVDTNAGVAEMAGSEAAVIAAAHAQQQQAAVQQEGSEAAVIAAAHAQQQQAAVQQQQQEAALQQQQHEAALQQQQQAAVQQQQQVAVQQQGSMEAVPNPMAAAIAAAHAQQQQAAVQQQGAMDPMQQMQMQMMAAMQQGMGGGMGFNQLGLMQMMQQMQQMQQLGAGGQTNGQSTAAMQAQAITRSAPYEQQAPPANSGHQTGNLYVGSIPRTMTDGELLSLFSPMGTVMSCKIQMDPMTQQSKGFGFVRFAAPEEAMKAIEQVNGHNGMQVKFAANDPGKGSGKGGPRSDNLYIRGLPSPAADPDQLFKLFTDLGLTVSRHKLIADTKGVGTSAAMVQLASVEEAQSAITQLNGKEFFGNMLFLSFVEAAKGDPSGAYAMNSRILVRLYREDQRNADPRQDNLFVGGLPSPTVDQAQLNYVFAGKGFSVVRSKMLPDTRGKGASSALVQLGSREEAMRAIEALNGQSCDALNLKAAQMPDTYDPSKYDERKMPIHGNLFIGNIPKPFSEKDLMKMFEECGNIRSCKISRHENGDSKGSGFVKFETPEEAKIAIDSLHGFNNLVVKPADFDIGKGFGAKGFKDLGNFGNFGGSPAWLKGGKDAKVIPPRMDAGFQSPLELAMSAKFASESGDELQPSETVFILGLPSPVVEEARLIDVFLSMGIRVGKVETIPDDTNSQCSAAMVQFPSIQAASQARAAVDGKKPSELGLAAKGASKGHALVAALKGMKAQAYGKGFEPRVVPGPYAQKGWGKGDDFGKGWGAKGEQQDSSTSSTNGGWNQSADGAWGSESSSDAPAQFGKGPFTSAWNSTGGGDGAWGADRSSETWQTEGSVTGGNGSWGQAQDQAWSSGGKDGACGGESWAAKGNTPAWNPQAWSQGEQGEGSQGEVIPMSEP